MAENKDKAAKALKAAEEAFLIADAHWAAAKKIRDMMNKAAGEARVRLCYWDGPGRPTPKQLHELRATADATEAAHDAAEDYFMGKLSDVRAAERALDAARKAYEAATAV
jgi:hypothetical protein